MASLTGAAARAAGDVTTPRRWPRGATTSGARGRCAARSSSTASSWPSSSIYAAPMIGVILTSLQSNAEIAARGVWHIPENASLANFADVMSTTPLPRYLFNSFLRHDPGDLLLGHGRRAARLRLQPVPLPLRGAALPGRHRGHVLPAAGHAHPALPLLQRSRRDRRLPGAPGRSTTRSTRSSSSTWRWAWRSRPCSCAIS